jgi:hypothetical protein
MRLLELDGWVRGGRRTHGIFFSRIFPGESFPRSTVIPDKAAPLPATTLGAILSVKQSGLGRTGLQELVEKYR